MTRGAARWVPAALSVLALAGCIVVRQEQAAPPAGRGEELPQVDPVALDAGSDARAPGSLGWALLSPSVPETVIEVDSAGEAALADEAVAALEETLREHGRKAKVQRVERASLPVREVYSQGDLRALASDHREHSSGDGTVAVYVLVLPGRFETGGVPGVAFHATSFAVFPGQISGRLPPGTDTGAFQTAVVVHEVGHLIGLVNLTGKGAFHEDDDHPGHAGDEDSPMHWAVESAGILDVFSGGPPTRFTEDDRREMGRIREDRP